MALPFETVARIAELARLGLADAEIKKMRQDLSQVLGFFQELERYQLESFGSLGNEEARYSARTDRSETTSEEMRTGITGNFPATRDGFLKVRSVF